MQSKLNHYRRLVSSTACTIVLGLLCGCTSLGHESRAIPKIAKPTANIVEFGFDSDDNTLSVALERLLDRHGILVSLLSTPQVRQQYGDKEYTYDEVQTRYVLRVRSTDLDLCLPEGSRQMHFEISVTDFETRQRVLLMKDKFGCCDAIVTAFEEWLLSGREPHIGDVDTITESG